MATLKQLETRLNKLEGILEKEISANEKRPTETELIYRFMQEDKGIIFFNETDGRYNAQVTDYSGIYWGEGFTIGGAIRDFKKNPKRSN